MSDIFKGVEPLVYESRISVPYTWWAGDTASRFLVALRDEEKITGTKCSGCNKVYVPPRKTCPSCFTENSEWVELPDEGTLQAFTVVRKKRASLPLDKKLPVIYGLVKIDGADTAMLHFLDEVDPDTITIGMRMKARFSETRSGIIRDILYFRPV